MKSFEHFSKYTLASELESILIQDQKFKVVWKKVLVFIDFFCDVGLKKC